MQTLRAASEFTVPTHKTHVPIPSRSAVRWALLLLFFSCLAVAIIWPAPRLAYVVLPSRTNRTAAVPMLNAWTIWWNADRLQRGLHNYWDAPIFYPERGTFAFSDPQPATWIVAPIVWSTGSPVPAYQMYFVISLVLNGVFATRLLLTLRISWWPAVGGGIAMLLHPLVHCRNDVLQLMPLWGVLWSIDAFWKLRCQPSWRRGLVLGLAFASVFLTSVHHGLFWTWLLVPTAWIAMPRQRRQWMASLGIALLAASAVLTPLLLPMHRIIHSHDFSREAPTVQALSATLADWAHVPPRSLVQLPLEGPPPICPLSPGWLRVVAVVLGTPLLLLRRRSRRFTLLLLAVAAWAFLLSFGQHLQLGSWHPWAALQQYVPGFAQVRSAYRFAYFTQMALLLLVPLSLGHAVCWCRLKTRRPWTRRAARSVLALAGLLLAFEVLPGNNLLLPVPDTRREPAWTTYLKNHQDAEPGIACLPVARGVAAEDYVPTARWMLYGTIHQRPMVNGYSGFFPATWSRITTALSRAPFDQETLKMLVNAQVRYLVIDTRSGLTDDPITSSEGPVRLVCVLQDTAADIEIWELQGLSPTSQRRRGGSAVYAN
jgi:hypothetical protein